MPRCDLFIYFYGAQLAAILFLVSLTLLVIAILKSEWLSVLNLAWSRLGIILSKIFNPIILGLIFFLLITPVGIAGRLLGRDILLLRSKNTHSSWQTYNKQQGTVWDQF